MAAQPAEALPVGVGPSIRVISMSRQNEPRHLARLTPDVRRIVENVFDNRAITQKVAATLALTTAFLLRPRRRPVIFGPGFQTIHHRIRTARLAFAFARPGLQS